MRKKTGFFLIHSHAGSTTARKRRERLKNFKAIFSAKINTPFPIYKSMQFPRVASQTHSSEVPLHVPLHRDYIGL